MGSTIFSIFIVACIIWIVARTGKRHARYAMRRLAQQAGGIYMDGGLLSRSYVMLNRGAARLQVQVRSQSMIGGHYLLVLHAPWPNRIDCEERTPQEYAASKLAAKAQSELSELHNMATKLDVLAPAKTLFSANSQGFCLQTEIQGMGPNRAIQWYEAAVKLYDLMLADTEPGLEFVSADRAPKIEVATCQVCGTSPDPQETVLCDRCGAPHHAECWEYNGGCAIFGCRPSSNR